jgi:hypothetical protein
VGVGIDNLTIVHDGLGDGAGAPDVLAVGANSIGAAQLDETDNYTMSGTFDVATPTTAGNATPKSYVDSLVNGLDWKPHVEVDQMVGSDAALDIEAFSVDGDSYVVDTANGAGALSGAAVGDIVERVSGTWTVIVTNVGGFPPADHRALASTGTALNGTINLTAGVDNGKCVEWDGTSLTPATEVTSLDGQAVLVAGEGATSENKAYVFDGVVPTGVWVLFSQLEALTGGDGIDLTTTPGEVNVDLLASGGLKFTTGELGTEPADFAGNGIEDDGSDKLRLATTVTVTYADAPGTVITFPNTTTAQGAFLTGNGVDALHPVPLQQLGAGLNSLLVALSWKAAAIVAELSSNINLASLPAAIDGVALNVGDRFYVGGQTSGAENGIYLYGGAGSAATRAPDMPAGQPTYMASFGVAAGTNAENFYYISNDPGSDIPGGDTLQETQFASFSAGDGIDIAAGSVSVDATDLLGKGLTESSNNFDHKDLRQETVTTQVITGTDTALTDTLNGTPINNASVSAFLNGVLQHQGAGLDYTISGSTITWLASSGTAVNMDLSDVLHTTYHDV